MTLIADRLSLIKPSPTLAMTQKAAELRAQGRDVIGLSAGEPDFDTPDHIKEAAIQAIRDGQTKYTNVDGTPALKEAIQAKFKRENGLEFEIGQVMAATGGKQILFNAFLASLNPGDEVLIPAPYWVSYPDMVLLAGGQPKFIDCPENTGFKLTPDLLRGALTDKTKWVIVNSPNNPTGSGYHLAELEALAGVLRDFPHVQIMTDDMYEHIAYDGFEATTLAQVAPDLFARTLTTNGVSKAFAMTGWRIGFAGGPAPLIAAMRKIQSQSTANPSSISQAASVAALNGPMDFLAERNAAFKARRDMVVTRINETPGLSTRTPEGAFYVFASCAGLIGAHKPDGGVIQSDADVGDYFLDHDVAVVPGVAFGLSPFFRISYATSTEALEKACARIRDACEKLDLKPATAAS